MGKKRKVVVLLSFIVDGLDDKLYGSELSKWSYTLSREGVEQKSGPVTSLPLGSIRELTPYEDR